MILFGSTASSIIVVSTRISTVINRTFASCRTWVKGLEFKGQGLRLKGLQEWTMVRARGFTAGPKATVGCSKLLGTWRDWAPNRGSITRPTSHSHLGALQRAKQPSASKPEEGLNFPGRLLISRDILPSGSFHFKRIQQSRVQKHAPVQP